MLDQDYKGVFPPFVDLGWRLKPSSWGNGYATEGAKACINYGFKTFNFEELYAVTPKPNIPSQKVMQKVGMEFVQEFEHPKIPKESPLCRCCLFQINRPQS